MARRKSAFEDGGGLFDNSVGGRQKNQRLLLVFQAVDQLESLGAGPLEAGRLFVSALHRGRCVKYDDAQIPAVGSCGR